jgi:hypothetical protein
MDAHARIGTMFGARHTEPTEVVVISDDESEDDERRSREEELHRRSREAEVEREFRARQVHQLRRMQAERRERQERQEPEERRERQEQKIEERISERGGPRGPRGSRGPRGPRRVYLLYGGRGSHKDEDVYAREQMAPELQRQLERALGRPITVQAVRYKASKLKLTCEADALIVLWRDFLGGQDNERWAGDDGAWAHLRNMTCVPRLADVDAIFTKRPYMEILRRAEIPTIVTEFVGSEQFRTARFEHLARTLEARTLVVKLPNCSQGRSIAVVTSEGALESAIATATRQSAPFVMVQPYKVFNEVRVFVAGNVAHRAVLTLHGDTEKKLRVGAGLHCAVPVRPDIARLALATFDAVVAGNIRILSARIDIGVVDTKCDVDDEGDLVCSDVGRIVFVNEVTSVECDVFPGAPGGDDSSLDAFTQANVAEIVAEIQRL